MNKHSYGETKAYGTECTWLIQCVLNVRITARCPQKKKKKSVVVSFKKKPSTPFIQHNNMAHLKACRLVAVLFLLFFLPKFPSICLTSISTIAAWGQAEALNRKDKRCNHTGIHYQATFSMLSSFNYLTPCSSKPRGGNNLSPGCWRAWPGAAAFARGRKSASLNTTSHVSAQWNADHSR